MAKNLPYFKFTVAEWLTGDIFYEPFNVQGVFISICALYWQRNGILMVDDINKRLRNPSELELLKGKFLTIKDGFIFISFLDEQLTERKPKAEQNKINGSKGGRPTGSTKPENKEKKTQSVILGNPIGLTPETNIDKNKKRKEKNSGENFNFDFVEESFKTPFRVWYKYRMEIKPFRVQAEVEASYSELKNISNLSALEAFKIIQSSIANGYNSLQLPTSKTPIQTNNLQGTI
jgi:hypothetical protein